ncbi:MAG: hypothetical protein ETSY2_49280 [Candidatus Entotheonella gemina]|uniref:Uncharacterized protein n=1 Tax=Candidatus Entotheonella gemina TaxID=1429439 RepID=W4L9P0_9BACT|nr:MAG: hypothetical protein ETSY2_49280 [Candidatus Entotheonella gemina]
MTGLALMSRHQAEKIGVLTICEAHIDPIWGRSTMQFML